MTVRPVSEHTSEAGRRRVGDPFTNLPGLDGLRGLAVVAVIAFHAGLGRMVGGFLGVSTFFTLSGFLVTGLLVRRSRHSPAIALRPFWERRARRLLPASLATLAGIVLLFGPFVATADQRRAMPADVLAALFEVANWHDIASGSSYGALFTAPSPVLHFWSLSIEAQFYVALPVLVLSAWRFGRRRRVTLAAILGGLALLSALEPVVFSMSPDRVYYGTDTRAVELLIGGLLGLAWTHEPIRRRLVIGRGVRVTVPALGALALGLQLWWWSSLPLSTPWLSRGGFTGYAVLSCLVILAAAVPVGPVSAVLRSAPLRWLGVRSFGIYLLHWPVMLAVRQLHPGTGPATSATIAVVISVLGAAASYRLIEQPVRTGRWPAPGRVLRTSTAAVAVMAVATLTLPSASRHESAGGLVADPATYDRLIEAHRSAASPDSTNPARPAADPVASSTVAAPPVPTMAPFGDSTVLGVGMALARWAMDTRRLTGTRGDFRVGCGIPRFDAIRTTGVKPDDPECRDWPGRWAERIRTDSPDIALVMSAVWSVPDARLPGSDRWSAIGDPRTDDFIRDEYLAAVDVLSSRGALVMLVTWPRFGDWVAGGRSGVLGDQVDGERMARMNRILTEVAARRPESVRVVDLAGWLGDRSQDRALRPDGVHFSEATFRPIVDEWMGPEIERIWTEWWTRHRTAMAAGPAAPGPATADPATAQPAVQIPEPAASTPEGPTTGRA